MSENGYEFNQLSALFKGLNTTSSGRFFAAVYLCSELNNDFDTISDGFTYDHGHGMYNETIGFSLPAIYDDAAGKQKVDYEEFEKKLQEGEALSEYDNLNELALYHFAQQKGESEVPPGGQKRLSGLEDRSEELSTQIKEIEHRLQ